MVVVVVQDLHGSSFFGGQSEHKQPARRTASVRPSSRRRPRSFCVSFSF